MKKDKLQKIKDIAKFVLPDNEYRIFEQLLNNNKFKRARLFINELIEVKEIDLIVDSNDVTLTEYKQLDNIENLVIDLIVNEEDLKNEEGHKFRPIIKP